jgi:S-methylmethionine-dependent homocysteine/selenocysteine methylase
MREPLPQLSGEVFLADGGMETTLIFGEGFELPHFAAFDLLKDDEGRAALRDYYRPYVELARERAVGIVLDTATWRASRDWGELIGHTAEALAELNRQAVALVDELRGPDDTIVIAGAIGPRGDGYRADRLMTASEAERYHAEQIATFADTVCDLVCALTLTYPDEAVGIVRAARAAGIPAAISFTVETDGRLPNGMPLREAIEHVDAETDGAAAYFMVNCAHPTHFAHVLDDEAPWISRIRGLRANASAKSHAELDDSEELDAGDPVDLGSRYVALRERLPGLTVLGGCCGTDHRHIAEIHNAWVAADPPNRANSAPSGTAPR